MKGGEAMKANKIATFVGSVPAMWIYGMNIPLPFQQHGNAFAIVMGVSCVLAILIGALFVILSRNSDANGDCLK